MSNANQKTFTLEEVEKHVTKESLWLIIHNNVYDGSLYQKDHPGGAEVLLQYSGAQDATEVFEATGHSDDARSRLNQLFLGCLKEEDQQENIEVFHKVYPDTHNPDRSPPGVKFYLLSAVGIGAVGMLIRRIVVKYNILSRLSSWWHKPFNQGLFAAGSISLIIGAYALKKSLKYIVPQTKQKRFDQFRAPHVKFARKPIQIPPKSLFKCPLDKNESRDLLLHEKVQISHDTYRFSFKLPNPAGYLGIPVGTHISIYAEIEGETITRSYTPASSPLEAGKFDLVIKVYPDGKMGNWLVNQEPGKAKIPFRGPKGRMNYKRGWASSILMIAGGSGITPMFQLLLSICEDKQDKTKITLLYANKTEEDILLRKEIDELVRQTSGQLKVIHVLSHADESWKGPRGFINEELIKEDAFTPSEKDNRVLLCGPPPMIKAMKGALDGAGYEQIKASSSMLDQIFVF